MFCFSVFLFLYQQGEVISKLKNVFTELSSIKGISVLSVQFLSQCTEAIASTKATASTTRESIEDGVDSEGPQCRREASTTEDRRTTTMRQRRREDGERRRRAETEDICVNLDSICICIIRE